MSRRRRHSAPASQALVGEVLGAVHSAPGPVSASYIARQIGRPRLIGSVTDALRLLGDSGQVLRTNDGWVEAQPHGNTAPPRDDDPPTVELAPQPGPNSARAIVLRWVDGLSPAARVAMGDHLSQHDWARLWVELGT